MVSWKSRKLPNRQETFPDVSATTLEASTLTITPPMLFYKIDDRNLSYHHSRMADAISDEIVSPIFLWWKKSKMIVSENIQIRGQGGHFRFDIR